MIDIPETHTCGREVGGKKVCACVGSPTKLTSCKFIIPVRSPGERIDPDPEKMAKRKAAIEEAAVKVENCTRELAEANARLWKRPRSPSLRRLQAKAFSNLGQAQYELEQALDHVPPVPDADQLPAS